MSKAKLKSIRFKNEKSPASASPEGWSGDVGNLIIFYLFMDLLNTPIQLITTTTLDATMDGHKTCKIKLNNKILKPNLQIFKKIASIHLNTTKTD